MERLSQTDIQTIDLSLTKWYYEQANIRHTDLVRIDNVITDRAYTLFALYFAILTACIGYVLTHLMDASETAISTACASFIVFDSISIYYIYKVIWPHDIYSPGKMPDSFAIDNYLHYFSANKVEGDLQFKRVLSDELVFLQIKSSQLANSNKNRIKHLKYSIRFLLLGSALAVILMLVDLLWL